jgi:predicted transcriptional regulator YdeE
MTMAGVSKPVLHERFEHADVRRLAGLAGWFEPSTYADIADMWKRFAAQLGFPGQLGGGETVGVFRNRDSAAQSFEHLAAVRIVSDAGIPVEFEVWDLPPQDYLVFRQMLTEEPLHLQVMAAQSALGGLVTRAGYQRVDADDLQIYPAKFWLGNGGWLEHWIPVDD